MIILDFSNDKKIILFRHPEVIRKTTYLSKISRRGNRDLRAYLKALVVKKRKKKEKEKEQRKEIVL